MKGTTTLLCLLLQKQTNTATSLKTTQGEQIMWHVGCILLPFSLLQMFPHYRGISHLAFHAVVEYWEYRLPNFSFVQLSMSELFYPSHVPWYCCQLLTQPQTNIILWLVVLVTKLLNCSSLGKRFMKGLQFATLVQKRPVSSSREKYLCLMNESGLNFSSSKLSELWSQCSYERGVALMFSFMERKSWIKIEKILQLSEGHSNKIFAKLRIKFCPLKLHFLGGSCV